ncbi:MAG: 4-hydroxy-tetrahydrodipicolinate reductase [Pseudomonadota bacterium]
MINILMNGCNGKMGQVITKLRGEYDNVNIAAGVTRNPGKLQNPYPVYGSFGEVKEKIDVVLDFSNPEILAEEIQYCVSNQTALVVGTTGLSDKEQEMLRQASESIPVFVSANMTFGISVLVELVLKAASTLGDGYDIEIIEKHHNEKKDAPSGTALMIANELKKQINNSAEFIYDRSNKSEKRRPDEIGILSLRGGTITGEHTVYFAGKDEIIEIKHTAASRNVLGRGAIRAAVFTAARSKGYYNMKSLLEEMI